MPTSSTQQPVDLDAYRAGAASPAPLRRLNFDSDLFDTTLEHCLGSRIVEKARRLKKTEQFQRSLDWAFRVGDDAGDALAARVVRDPEVQRQYEVAVRQGLAAVENPTEEIRRFFEWSERMPAALDREMVELGGEVFRRSTGILSLMLYGLPVGMTLQATVPGIIVPLWYTYQDRQGPARPLHLAGNRPEVQRRNAVRYTETWRWFGTVAEPGAGALFSEAYSENCRIRIIHGHIRPVVKRNNSNWNYAPTVGWDPDVLGTPLSVGDGTIVASTLVAAVSAMRRHFGLAVSDHEMDALSQWACYVHYQQGVSDEFLFSTFEENMTHFAAFFMSIDPYIYNLECTNLIHTVRNMHLERAMFAGSRLGQTLLDGLLQASIENMMDEPLRTNYGIPPAPAWSRPLFAAVRGGLRATNALGRMLPPLQRRLRAHAVRTWTDIIPQAERSVREYYGVVAEGTRLENATR